MNLLHIVATLDPKSGGVSQAVRTMVISLSDLGIHNELVSLDGSEENFLYNNPALIHPQGPGKGPWHYNNSLRSWLVENLFRFDSIILHGLWLYPGFATNSAMQALRRIREKSVPKLFIMPHGMLDPYFQRASGRKFKALRNWVYWKLIENKVINHADGILFTSQEELRLARQPFQPYNPQKELIIGLGVQEPPPFSVAMQEAFLRKCPRLNNRPYLLFLGRIHEKKGVDILIKAYLKVFESPDEGDNSPDNPALVISGPGLDSTYGKRIRQLAADSKSIHFTGMLEGPEKWGAFYGCEAFVLPSHQENFGVAVVEAMACSKAVLISNQVNIWREIEASKGGLVEDDTLQGTEVLLEKWRDLSVQEKQKFGIRSKRFYHEYYAAAPAAERLIDAVK